MLLLVLLSFGAKGMSMVSVELPSVFRKRPGVAPGVFTFKTLSYRYAIATPGKQKSRQPPATLTTSAQIESKPHHTLYA